MDVKQINPANMNFDKVADAANKIKDKAADGVHIPINAEKIKDKIGDVAEFSKEKAEAIKDKIKAKNLPEKVKDVAQKVKDVAQNVAEKIKSTASTKKGKVALIAVAGGLVGLAAKAIHDKIANKNETAETTDEYEVVE